MLAHLRLPPDSAGGRKYPELPHPYRNDYQRDRDRIIHSRGFRRLGGKTQVFAPAISDHIRDRLTHTIEVSQVARTVASALELNEEFTETLALAHDIGHPPFAHAGEKELNRKMHEHGLSFEHNLQSLRTVDVLEQRYALFDGLNLTFEVREGIVKHSREVEKEHEPELTEFLPGLKPPVEAQLLDLADEIAYNAADLDDALSAGVITIEDMERSVPFLAERFDEVRSMFPGASERIMFNEVERLLINFLVGGLMHGTREAAEKIGAKTPDDVRHAPCRLARMTEESAQVNRQLKTFLAARMYETGDLVVHRRIVSEKVSWLFDYLIAHPEYISAGFRENLSNTALPRVVCDFIAGMTDAYFMRTYEALAQ